MVAIADIDTRKLTRLLRDKGAQRGCIAAGETVNVEKANAMIDGFPWLEGHGFGEGSHDRQAL